jgi:putative PIN family toxin of toxin-antitoxin system
MMRIVLDTNVTVSALLWRGTPYRLVETIRRQRQDHLFTSPALLEELADILTRPFAAKRLALLGRTGEDLLADYAGFAEMVKPRTVPAVVIADPDDDQVIAAAVAAKADIIVSGDHHLLSLGSHRGIQILRPAEMLTSITGAPE